MEPPKSNLDSLFAEYILEREGENVITAERGFATYKFGQGYCYITDIYVQPEARKSGLASSLADEVCKIAKSHSVSLLVGSVDTEAVGATTSMKALLGYGFSVSHNDGSMIYFKKEI
jgi:predicted GNAT family acetyltransferase